MLKFKGMTALLQELILMMPGHEHLYGVIFYLNMQITYEQQGPCVHEKSTPS